jgi:predicted nuclease of predicted toxin-antitoxin system
MNFLLDVHLQISLSKFLSNQPCCTSTHINQILNKWNTTDEEICRYADKHNLIVITKDEDFKNSHFISKTPKKVIRVALGNISNADLIKIFEKYMPFILPVSQKSSLYIEFDKEQIVVID